MTTSKLMPVLFLSHGGGPCWLMSLSGPVEVMNKNSRSGQFMRNLKSVVYPHLPAEIAKPSCILIVSAHWDESSFTVGYQTGKTKLLYDYGGFPKEAYAPYLTYPCQTSIPIADKVIELLATANIPCDKEDRGYDHGVFNCLGAAFPEADIPVVQLSLKSNLDIKEHIKLGEALRPLRQSGVLIVGSGDLTHNLREVFNPSQANVKKAEILTTHIHNLLSNTTPENYEEKKQELINIAHNAPHFAWAHPTTEHFVPLAVMFGASFIPSNEEPAKKVPHAQRIYSEIVLGGLSLDSYMFL